MSRRLCIERAAGEDLRLAEQRARRALPVIVAAEGIHHGAVGRHAIGHGVAPYLLLALEALAQIEDREAAAVAGDVLLGELLCRDQPVIESARETGIVAIEPAAHHHD